VGLNLRPELVALKDVNGDASAFAAAAKKIADESEFGLILMSDKPDVMKAGAEASVFKSARSCMRPRRITPRTWGGWQRTCRFPWPSRPTGLKS
jgi:CO dehydrogenase/acetyl-CoA synthase gamma subunit (corrinoid Fe-S protein)